MQGNLEVSTDFSFPGEYSLTGIRSEERLEKLLKILRLLIVVMLEKSVVCSKKVLIQSQWNGMETAISFHTSQIKLHFLCSSLLWL